MVKNLSTHHFDCKDLAFRTHDIVSLRYETMTDLINTGLISTCEKVLKQIHTTTSMIDYCCCFLHPQETGVIVIYEKTY